jgi:hypothetical protein
MMCSYDGSGIKRKVGDDVLWHRSGQSKSGMKEPRVSSCFLASANLRSRPRTIYKAFTALRREESSLRASWAVEFNLGGIELCLSKIRAWDQPKLCEPATICSHSLFLCPSSINQNDRLCAAPR